MNNYILLFKTCLWLLLESVNVRQWPSVSNMNLLKILGITLGVYNCDDYQKKHKDNVNT